MIPLRSPRTPSVHPAPRFNVVSAPWRQDLVSAPARAFCTVDGKLKFNRLQTVVALRLAPLNSLILVGTHLRSIESFRTILLHVRLKDTRRKVRSKARIRSAADVHTCCGACSDVLELPLRLGSARNSICSSVRGLLTWHPQKLHFVVCRHDTSACHLYVS